MRITYAVMAFASAIAMSFCVAYDTSLGAFVAGLIFGHAVVVLAMGIE